MQAVTLLTGRGGWPMSSFLTPEGKTFLGDSYFPPEPFKKLLLRVNEVWQQQNALVLKRADEVATAVANSSVTMKPTADLIIYTPLRHSRQAGLNSCQRLLIIKALIAIEQEH
jgi:uncharacterized protein YyaL (SSP411 family)